MNLTEVSKLMNELGYDVEEITPTKIRLGEQITVDLCDTQPMTIHLVDSQRQGMAFELIFDDYKDEDLLQAIFEKLKRYITGKGLMTEDTTMLSFRYNGEQ